MSHHILILQTVGNPRHFSRHEGILTLARHVDPSRWTLSVAVPHQGGLTEALAAEGVGIHEIPGLQSYRRHEAWWRLPWLAMGVARAARKSGAHLLMANHPELGPFAFVAARLTGLPWISFLRHSQQSNRYYKKFFITAADAVGGVCQSAIDSYRCYLHSASIPAKNLHVVRTGFDLPGAASSSAGTRLRAEVGWSPAHKVIGTVGSCSVVRKRPELLLEFLAATAAKTPHARGLVVGDMRAEDRSRLEGKARSLRVDGRVHFAGHQSDLGPYYCAMDIYAHPSRSEGLPKAVLEAMIHRLPVVAFAIGGIPEAVQEGTTGFLASPDDLSSFNHHLLHLVTNPELGTRMGEAGRIHIEENFSSSQMTEGMMRLFDCALAEKKQRGDGR